MMRYFVPSTNVSLQPVLGIFSCKTYISLSTSFIYPDIYNRKIALMAGVQLRWNFAATCKSKIDFFHVSFCLTQTDEIWCEEQNGCPALHENRDQVYLQKLHNFNTTLEGYKVTSPSTHSRRIYAHLKLIDF